jgi:hypothetical protein
LWFLQIATTFGIQHGNVTALADSFKQAPNTPLISPTLKAIQLKLVPI